MCSPPVSGAGFGSRSGIPAALAGARGSGSQSLGSKPLQPKPVQKGFKCAVAAASTLRRQSLRAFNAMEKELTHASNVADAIMVEVPWMHQAPGPHTLTALRRC